MAIPFAACWAPIQRQVFLVAAARLTSRLAEANEDLNKADCKNSLDGAAKRACEKSAKMQAKSEKADAKTVHEQEKKAISNAAKPAN